jgi:hypothetical protein
MEDIAKRDGTGSATLIVNVNNDVKPHTSVDELVKALRPRRPPSRFARFMFKTIAIAWDAVGLLGLATINILAMAEALSRMNPGLFGVKLSRWITPMARFAFWHKIQIAHLIAALFLMFMTFAWATVAKDLFLKRGNELHEDEFNLKHLRIAWRITCIGLFILDLWLFYIGSSAVNTWLGGRYTFGGFLLTLMYGFFVIVYAIGHLLLWHQVRRNES